MPFCPIFFVIAAVET